MTFQEAVLGQLPQAKRDKAQKRSGPVRRLMWKAAENLARHKIEAKTGERLPAKVDWAKWIDFLKEIMPLILKILALFGV